MLVRCSNCQTQFALEDRQVGPDGAAVRCSVCSYVFRLEQDTNSLWQIETVDGELFSAPDLATLRAWISEGRLHPDDRVSRTGKKWLKLGAMPEFSDAFAGFADLPMVFRTFEPTPLPSLPDLGPPPDFNHSAGGEEILPAILDGASSTEIGLFEGNSSADLGLFLGGEDSSNTVSLNPLADLLLPAEEDLTPGPLVLEDEPPVSAPLHVAEERPALQGRAAMPEPEARRAVEGVPLSRSGTMPEASGTFLSASSEAIPAHRAASTDAYGRVSTGGSWRWMVGIAVVGAGVAFAFTPVRERLFDPTPRLSSATEASVSPGPVADALPPEVEAARAALHRADKLSQVEAALQSRLEDEALAPRAVAALKLAQVELFSTRALLARIAAAVDRDSADAWGYRANDDAERAGQIFAGTDVSRLAAEDVSRARTRLRLVQGRPASELGDAGGNVELERIIQAAPLWRDPDRPVPEAELDGWIDGFQRLPEPSAVARLLLALSHARRGDATVARQLVDAILAESPEQASAVALKTRLQTTTPPPAETSQPQPKRREPSNRATEEGSEPAAPKPARGPVPIDKLIHQGCDAVDAGRPQEGIPDLVKAFDRRPHDVDVLTCLGSAHLQLGNATTANRYFQLALDRSPQLVPALRGAARVAKRNGQRERARELYGRLLANASGDREAKTYLEDTAPPSTPVPATGE